MAAAPLSIEVMIETLRLWEEHNQNGWAAARSINVPVQTFQHRLTKAKEKFPKGVPTEIMGKTWVYKRLVRKDVPSSRWIIGSDIHIWDGEPTIIYKAFIKIAKSLKVDGIILNGDVIDGARISRHPSIRGSKAPKIEKEIETAKKWIKMLPKAKHQLWTIGNHDIRIDNYIAANAGELDGYILSLGEHFPAWELAWAFEINNTEVRHRFRAGIHAGWNNTLHSGASMVTGHTHQLQVTAMRDRKGSRWGVETGMMADPFGPQFEYSEGSPSRSQQGFAVLTFDDDGVMLPPELCEMIGGRPVFRGQYVL
jgi:UDP-2,3-diacylglucosamine pyrophosphatase LpxH